MILMYAVSSDAKGNISIILASQPYQCSPHDLLTRTPDGLEPCMTFKYHAVNRGMFRTMGHAGHSSITIIMLCFGLSALWVFKV